MEVSPEQIDQCIDLAIQKFTDFAMDGTEKTLLQLPIIPNVFTYMLDPRVVAVNTVRFKSNNFSYNLPGGVIVTPTEFLSSAVLPTGNIDILSMSIILSRMSMIEHMFNAPINFDWNEYTKKLVFFEDPQHQGSSVALLEVTMKYEPQDIDMIYDNQWVKEYAMYQTQLVWGKNVGKFSGALIGGATINHERIISEALDEIKRLEGELQSKWGKPLPIMRSGAMF